MREVWEVREKTLSADHTDAVPAANTACIMFLEPVLRAGPGKMLCVVSDVTRVSLNSDFRIISVRGGYLSLSA